MPRVAIILTSYNRPVMVRKSINSVLKQTVQDFTLYIMDGNSISSVRALLGRYKQKSSKIQLFFSDETPQNRTKKCGYAVEINRALRISKEPLITYLTDDAGMYPNKLSHMVRWMDQHLGGNVCYGNQRVVNRAGKQLFVRGGYGIVRSPGGKIDHNQIMFRRRILEKVGYWPEDRSHICDKDAVWFHKVVSKGHKFYPINKLTDWLIYHPKQLTSLVIASRETKKWAWMTNNSLRE